MFSFFRWVAAHIYSQKCELHCFRLVHVCQVSVRRTPSEAPKPCHGHHQLAEILAENCKYAVHNSYF
jgi:hypothetical protein